MGPSVDDDALLAAWRRGDRAAGNALVQRHFTAVYRFLRRRIDDPAAAKDLAQRTFMTCQETRDRVVDGLRFRAWAIGIARHLLLRWVRDGERARAREGRAVSDGSVVSPSRVVAEREEQALLRRALRELPEDLRTTIELHYWEELTTTEIAAILDVAPGTIKWRLSRARDRLRAAIASLPPAVRATTEHRIDALTRPRPGDGGPEVPP